MAILVLSLWVFSQFLMTATHLASGQSGAVSGSERVALVSHHHGVADVMLPAGRGGTDHDSSNHDSAPFDAGTHCDVGCLMIVADRGGDIAHPPLASRYPAAASPVPPGQPQFLTSPPPETFA
jgi:hypothetical protein